MARYFKVWDVSQTIKRIVKANDIGELKSKGRQVLGLNSDDAVLVCLIDGTQIDDDDSLIAFGSEILILSTGQGPPGILNPSLPQEPPPPYCVIPPVAGTGCRNSTETKPSPEGTIADFFRIKHSRNMSTKTNPQAPPTVVETQDMATNTDDLPDDVDFEMELGDELTKSGGDNKGLSQAAKVGLGIGLGAIGTIVLSPVAVAAAGFGAAGIAGGSLAAAMMSSAAVANGGAVAAGSAVAVLQSIGAVSLGATGTAVVGGVGGAVGGVIGTAVAVLTRDKNRTRETQTDSNITKWKATKNKSKER